MLIDPGDCRMLNGLLAETKGRGRMESMGYAAVTTDEKLDYAAEKGYMHLSYHIHQDQIVIFEYYTGIA
jgi:hypothetical protein